MRYTQYDAQEEARLVSEHAAKEKVRQDVTAKMYETLGRDPDAKGLTDEPKVLDHDEMMRYKSLEIHEQTLRRETEDLKARIEAMQTIKPIEKATEKAKADPLMRWLRSGFDGLSEDERREQAGLADSLGMGGGRKFVDPIFKAAIVPGDNTNVLDETVVQSVIEGLSAFGGALQCFTVAMTPDGNVIKYPTYDDVTTAGARKEAVKQTGTPAAQQKAAQSEASGATALSGFNQVELSAYVRTTDFLDISKFLEEDVSWNVGAFVRKVLSNRMGRTIEGDLTHGGLATLNGQAAYGAPTANSPVGLMARATDYESERMTGANKAKIFWEDFNSLIHSVDAGYLKGEMGLYGLPMRPGKVGFMMNWEMLGRVKNLADSQNRPLIIPSIQTGSLDTLFGYPIFVNFELPHGSYATDHTRAVYFGNWGYFAVRFAGAGFAIEEFYDSNTAPTNARRYMGRVRYDSEYIGVQKSGKGPAVKCLKRDAA